MEGSLRRRARSDRNSQQQAARDNGARACECSAGAASRVRRFDPFAAAVFGSVRARQSFESRAINKTFTAGEQKLITLSGQTDDKPAPCVDCFGGADSTGF